VLLRCEKPDTYHHQLKHSKSPDLCQNRQMCESEVYYSTTRNLSNQKYEHDIRTYVQDTLGWYSAIPFSAVLRTTAFNDILSFRTSKQKIPRFWTLVMMTTVLSENLTSNWRELRHLSTYQEPKQRNQPLLP